MGEKEKYANPEEAAAVYLGGGVLFGFLGFHDLTNPSKAEEEYSRISTMRDRSARDSSTIATLASLHDGARKSRISGGIICAVLCGLQLTVFMDDEPEEDRATSYTLAGLDFVASTLCFVLKSEEEKTYLRYKKEQVGALTLSAGPYLSGRGVGMAVTVSF